MHTVSLFLKRTLVVLAVLGSCFYAVNAAVNQQSSVVTTWYSSQDAFFGVLEDSSIVKIVENPQTKKITIWYPASQSLETMNRTMLPADPKELLMFILSKLPIKKLKKVASKIMKILTAQFSDLAKVSDTIMMPLRSILRPVPLIPSTDLVSNFVISFVIDRYQRESFAYLKAFHMCTGAQYITPEEIELIKSRDEFEHAKGLLGSHVDLERFRDISRAISNHIDTFLKPLIDAIEALEKKASPVLKPLQALGRELRPCPLAPFVVGGSVYNRAVFICNIKQIEGLLQDSKAILENGLMPTFIDPGKYATLDEFAYHPLAKKFVFILQKTLSPAHYIFEHLDELFVDPIAQLPWGMKSVVCFILTILSTCPQLVSSITMETLLTTLSASIDVVGGMGAVTTAEKILVSIMNENFLLEFINETFYWAWIRYLQRRTHRLKELIRQARRDKMFFDGAILKREAQRILATT